MGYPAYPEVVESRVAWLGEIPAHWESKRLRFALKTNPSANKIDLEGDALVSFIPMDAVGESGGLRLDTDKALSEIGSGYTYFANGDVVVAKITPCFENGKGAFAAGLTNGIAFGTTELHVLRANGALDKRFLFHLTTSQTFHDLGESEMYGAGGQKRVPDTFIKNFRAALPPLPEQETIARFLDHKTAQIDALIAKKEALLQKLAEKRTALISQAVTKGLDPKVPMKDSGVAWLGQIPAHWAVKRQRFLISMHSGMTPNTGTPEFWDGDIPWVSPKDMKREWISGSIDTLSTEALAKTAIQTYPENHVLIVVRGMILAHSFPVAINVVPVTINQDMKAISTTLEAAYLAILLRGIKSLVLSLVEEAAHGTKVMRTDLFKNIRLPVPPPEEQREIVDAIERVVDQTDLMVKRVSAVIDKLKEYRSALITAAVTGKIDVRGVPLPAEVCP